jgi:AbrB family looped-hinge helix DNA binding protein
MQGLNYNASMTMTSKPSTSKVTERGQTTLPVKVRESLNAKPGDTLEYEIVENGVMVRVKQPDIRAVLAKFRGAFGSSPAKTKEEALKEFRALRDWDETDEIVFALKKQK